MQKTVLKKIPSTELMKNKQREIKNVEISIDEYVRDVARSFGEPYDDRRNRDNSNPSLRSVANQWGISICIIQGTVLWFFETTVVD